MGEEKSAAQAARILLKFGLHVEGAFRADGPMFIEEPASVGFRCQVVNCSIGAFTYLVGDNYLKTTMMGRYCSVAVGAAIAPDEHPTDGLTTSNFPYAQSRVSFYDDYLPTETWATRTKTVVGHDVWIGRGALIKSGVEIGSGVIVGAGAVVTRSVEPYGIVGGLPARLIRKRFSEPMIERLLKGAMVELRHQGLADAAPGGQDHPADRGHAGADRGRHRGGGAAPAALGAPPDRHGRRYLHGDDTLALMGSPFSRAAQGCPAGFMHRQGAVDLAKFCHVFGMG